MRELESADSSLDFSPYIDVFLRRRWVVIATLVIVLLSTFIYTFTTKPTYQGGVLLNIEKQRGGNTIAADGTMIESSNDDYYQTQYKLLKSRSLLEQVYRKLDLGTSPDFAQPRGLEKLEQAITVSPVPRSRLVYVRAESHEPLLAARVSNTLAEVFVSQNLANQLFISNDVLQALQVKQDDRDAKRVYAALPAVVNNTLIQQLRSDYARLQAQVADLSARYTAKHPALIALKANAAALDAQIQSETDKIVQSLKTELSGQLKGNNVRVIDPATVPELPIKPKKKIALLFGLIGGLVLGFIAAFTVESLDQTIRSQEDIESKLGLPFLGIVPLLPLGPEESPFSSLTADKPTLTSEAFRNLRTMIDFASVAEKSRNLLVTSAVQEEGKSYIASNLAAAFAQLGERVLLIDGDFRRPKLHKNFRLRSDRGLSEYLATDLRLENARDLLQTVKEVAGLTVLPCGIRPPNPSELLNTPRLSAFMAWSREHFDRIIVDCTPMFPISDTLLWGRHVSTCVFTVRYGKTRTALIRKAGQKLVAGGIRIAGVAINMAKPGGLAYAPYGYYYQQYYHAYAQDAAPTGEA